MHLHLRLHLHLHRYLHTHLHLHLQLYIHLHILLDINSYLYHYIKFYHPPRSNVSELFSAPHLHNPKLPNVIGAPRICLVVPYMNIDEDMMLLSNNPEQHNSYIMLL